MAVTTCKAAQNCTRLLWHPQGCWCFQSAHLPVHTELPLLPACSLVSVPLFFTNKEPLTSLNIYPSYAALQEYAIAQVVLFQVQEFSSVSQNWVLLVFMVCKCKACVCASSVTGMPVPNIWGFTWGSLLKGCVFFTVVFCISSCAAFSMICLPCPAVVHVCSLLFPSIFKICTYADDFVSLISI